MAGARASAKSCTWVKSIPVRSAVGGTRRMSSTRTTAAQADGPRPGPGLSHRAAGAAGPLIRTAPIPYTYTKTPHPAPFPRSPNRHASSPSVRRFRIRIRICCSVRGGAGEAHGRRGPAGRMPAGRPTAGCRCHDAVATMPLPRCRCHAGCRQAACAPWGGEPACVRTMQRRLFCPAPAAAVLRTPRPPPAAGRSRPGACRPGRSRAG